MTRQVSSLQREAPGFAGETTPAVEEALYDSRAMRRFVGIDLDREPAPDETTVCKFRHLLEAHNPGDQLFVLSDSSRRLQDRGSLRKEAVALCEEFSRLSFIVRGLVLPQTGDQG